MEEELVKRNTLYELEKQLRRNLTDTIQESYQGDHLDREITKLTNLLYIAVVGHSAEKIKRDRGFEKECSVFADILTSEERSQYINKENELVRCIRDGVQDYYELKDILLIDRAAIA